MNIENILLEFGLKNTESKIYIALLQIGKGTIIDLAKRSGIKRTTVYDILEELQQKGLVYKGIEEKRTIWLPHSPKKLEETIRLRYQHIKKIMPELEAYWRTSDVKPRIANYEGLEGIKTLFGSLAPEFKANQNYYIISSSKDWMEIDPEYFSDFIEKRTQKGVKSWLLTLKNPVSEEMAKNKKFGYKTKFLPNDINFKAGMIIYNGKIIFSVVDEKFAVMIESKFLYEQQEQMFRLLWKTLP